MNAIIRFASVTEKDVKNYQWHDEVCALGQSNPVVFNKGKTLAIISDATIYNLPELREELCAKGYACKAASAEEVILQLYELYGAKCVEHLRGMFALCIYDIPHKKLFVARDRIGEKTLYYSQIPGGLVISTDLKNILQNHIPSPQVNIHSLLEPLRYIAPLDMEQTWVQQIKRLQPGCYLEFDESSFTISQYWHTSRVPQIECSREEALARTLDLMQESVNLTMRGDKPIAIMLSGGVDSSAVASLAKRGGHEVHTITIGFGGEVEYDERAIARRLAEEKGFDHHEIVLNPEDYESAFEDLMQYVDEPITDSAVIAQWVLYKKVRELGYEVLLSGMGGDELFYNYAWLNNQANARKLRHQFDQICPVDTKERKKQWLQMMRANWKALIMPQEWHKTNESTYIPWYHDEFERFIKDATLRLNGREYQLRDYAPHQRYPECPVGRELDQAYDDAFDRVMVGAYLYLGGKVATANGIEIRCPLIDHKLVEYAMRLSQDMVGLNKNFMKEALEDILPDYILHAPKCGFTPTSHYPQMVADTHAYKYFRTSAPFYPVAVADQMLINLIQEK